MNGRTDIEEELRELQESAIATAANPGKLRLQTLRYLLHVKDPFIRWSKWFLVAFLALTIFVHWSFILGCLPLAWLLRRLLERTRLVCISGCINPAQVISTRPFRLAVWTDLVRAPGGKYDVIRIIPATAGAFPKDKRQLGTRVATISTYLPDPDVVEHWEDFEPIPVAMATSDVRENQRVLDSIGEDEWSSLTQGLEQLPDDLEQGLYRVFPPRRSLGGAPPGTVRPLLDETFGQAQSTSVTRGEADQKDTFKRVYGKVSQEIVETVLYFVATNTMSDGGLFFCINGVHYLIDSKPSGYFSYRELKGVFATSTTLELWVEPDRRLRFFSGELAEDAVEPTRAFFCELLELVSEPTTFDASPEDALPEDGAFEGEDGVIAEYPGGNYIEEREGETLAESLRTLLTRITSGDLVEGSINISFQGRGGREDSYRHLDFECIDGFVRFPEPLEGIAEFLATQGVDLGLVGEAGSFPLIALTPERWARVIETSVVDLYGLEAHDDGILGYLAEDLSGR